MVEIFAPEYKVHNKRNWEKLHRFIDYAGH